MTADFKGSLQRGGFDLEDRGRSSRGENFSINVSCRGTTLKKVERNLTEAEIVEMVKKNWKK